MRRRFREIENRNHRYLKSLGLSPRRSSRSRPGNGVGITEHTYTFEWYRPTVVEALDKLSPRGPRQRLRWVSGPGRL